MYPPFVRGGLRPLWAPGQKNFMGPRHGRNFGVENGGRGICEFEAEQLKISVSHVFGSTSPYNHATCK